MWEWGWCEGWRGRLSCLLGPPVGRPEFLSVAYICCPLSFRMAGIGTREGKRLHSSFLFSGHTGRHAGSIRAGSFSPGALLGFLIHAVVLTQKDTLLFKLVVFNPYPTSENTSGLVQQWGLLAPAGDSATQDLRWPCALLSLPENHVRQVETHHSARRSQHLSHLTQVT